MPDPTSLLEIGARLAVTRKALGLTQAEMDRRMGSGLTNGQTFNLYETGRQRIPTHHARALCRTCNITLDWIYRGQMHSLQPDICAKIETELDRLLNREERAGAARASVANERQSELTRTSQNPAGCGVTGFLSSGRETITEARSALTFSETDGLSDPHQSPSSLLNTNDNFFCSSRTSDP